MCIRDRYMGKNGKFQAQQIPIVRWICQTHNLYPTDPDHVYHVEVATEVINDMRSIVTKAWFSPPEQKEEAMKKLLTEEVPPQLKALENYFTQYCGENAWDKNSIGFADIQMVDFFTNIFFHPDRVAHSGAVVEENAPNFKKYLDNLINGPFKDYLSSRPSCSY
eukprot:TRINITY_DN5699_c0_g1_i20.p1 TRINITY_DN5699_c0_g1~~TRINITY_DN5699_c0_g1_i20.p1  ORF type:complete len:164 (+),score=51.91 TRINITY_DN5699_c0_g1_i20:66-557(+)